MEVYWQLIVSPQAQYISDRAKYDIGIQIAGGITHGVVEEKEYDEVFMSNKIDWIYFPNGTPKEERYVPDERVNESLRGDVY